MDMRAVVVWRVVDAAQAVYHVQNLEQFVRMQTETGLRSLAAQYPYDTGLSATTSAAEITLRNGGEHVSEVLRTLVQRRVRIAGVEARLRRLGAPLAILKSAWMPQQTLGLKHTERRPTTRISRSGAYLGGTGRQEVPRPRAWRGGGGAHLAPGLRAGDRELHAHAPAGPGRHRRPPAGRGRRRGHRQGHRAPLSARPLLKKALDTLKHHNHSQKAFHNSETLMKKQF